MAVPILLTKLDGFALLMAGSLGAIAFAMTLQFIELEAFQTKDYVFPVIVMLYLYTRNAHRFTEEPAAAPPPCDEPPIVARRRRCLLYTSPSPRDRQKSRMPSSA